MILWHGPTLARHQAVLDEEELTPKILRSFRPWPSALLAALQELDIPQIDAQRMVEELDSKPVVEELDSKPDAPPKLQQKPAALPSRSSDAAPCASLQLKPAALPSRSSDAAPCTSLPAVFINLAKRTDRRSSMENALAVAGIQAVRTEAIVGEDVPDETVCRVWDTTLNAKFDRNTVVRADLPMSVGERGCAGSHVLLWRRCAESDAALLVLEDDVTFSDGGHVGASTLSLVRAIEGALAPSERALLLYLGADAFPRDGAPSLRGKQAIWAARGSNAPCALKEAEWAWQTHAYVIWPDTARELLRG